MHRVTYKYAYKLQLSLCINISIILMLVFFSLPQILFYFESFLASICTAKKYSFMYDELLSTFLLFLIYTYYADPTALTRAKMKNYLYLNNY